MCESANGRRSQRARELRRRCRVLAALLVLLAAGCASPRPPTGPSAERGAQPAPAAPSRTLVMIARAEPPSLAVKPLQQIGGIGNINPIFNATLDFVDERGTQHPYLAEALPQFNTDTWRVFPDGRLETTYRLRLNLAWHDGTPLAAEDLAFALQVYATPALGVSGSIPISLMAEVVTPDPRTVTIRWRQPFPHMGRTRDPFQALPRHILEDALRQGDAESFANHRAWTHEYVGLGPYRLVRWDPGAAIEAGAFEKFALGPPKIDRIRIIFMSDSNTAVAALLSGEAHVAVDFVLMYEQGVILEQEWSARGGGDGGTVLHSPILYRNSLFQLRPELAATPALLDVRFRRALTHAVDMQMITDALIGGKAVVAPSLLSPLVDYYSAIDRMITKYPYDLRRAQQLLDEVGLPKGGDGFYVNPNGEPFKLEVRYTANPTHESENAIIVDVFRRLGVNAAGAVIPPIGLRDSQFLATLPGIFTTGARGHEQDMGRFSTAQIPRPDTRWQGFNRGAWSNAEYDRLSDAYNTTLDPSERIQQLAQMEKLFTEEVPAIPHYYTPIVAAHVGALRGPVARTSGDAVEVVHVHRWEWRS